MTREERLRFCKTCTNQSFDVQYGIICGITGQPADFEETCENYSESPILKAEMEKKDKDALIREKTVGKSRRFANFIIDALALYLFSLTAGMVLGVFLAFFWFEGLMMLETAPWWVSQLISFVFGMIYYILFETITGRTPGKYITGTRVICEDGSKPEFNTILLRSLIRFIPLEPFSFLGSQPTGWHDNWTKTLVVRHNIFPVRFTPQEYYPGIGQSFALTGLILLLMVAHAPLYLLFLPLGEEFSTFLYYTAFVGIAFLIIRRWRKKHTGEKGFYFSWRNLRFIPLVAVAAIAVQTGIISPLISLVPVPEELQTLMINEIPRFTLFGILAIVVVAPVMEEFIFRGIMQDGLTSHIGPLKAILLTSLLFGFIHLNPWQFITGFVLGVFLGWLYYLTRDIIMVITFHLVNNLFVVLVYNYAGIDPADGELHTILDALPQNVSHPLVISVSIAIALGLVVYFGFALKRVQTTQETTAVMPADREYEIVMDNEAAVYPESDELPAKYL